MDWVLGGSGSNGSAIRGATFVKLHKWLGLEWIRQPAKGSWVISCRTEENTEEVMIRGQSPSWQSLTCVVVHITGCIHVGTPNAVLR